MLHRSRTAFLAMAVCALAIFAVSGRAEAARTDCGDEPDTIVGSVVALASSVRQDGAGPAAPPSVSLLLRTDGGLVSVTPVHDARVTAADGRVTPLSDIPLSSRVRACGRRIGPMQFEATSIELLP